MDIIEADLAPGDRKTVERDWSVLEFHSVREINSPEFELAYRYLWEEFGRKHEIEQTDVIDARLKWTPLKPVDGYAMFYEMVLLTAHGSFAAARDHTVIVNLNVKPATVIVHMSHVLVHPIWRRTGLAGWLRAIPLGAVRRVLLQLGLPEDAPITMVAEMEHPHDAAQDRMVRLIAYEKAGFLKADPETIHFLQPDFRPVAEIEEAGGASPLPFALILRRVGKEDEPHMECRQLKEVIHALYTMYGRQFRSGDMAPVWQSLLKYPPDDYLVSLVPPSRP